LGGGGEGQADPGEFDIFREARVKFPSHRQLMNLKFQPLEQLFL